jgi:preprotein translocase subunit SecD
LPGVQDTAKAKDIMGRTATLEMRLVDDSAEARAAASNTGAVPFGDERFFERNGQAVIVKKQVILTGESLTDAQARLRLAEPAAQGGPHGRRQGRAHHARHQPREPQEAHGHPAV